MQVATDCKVLLVKLPCCSSMTTLRLRTARERGHQLQVVAVQEIRPYVLVMASSSCRMFATLGNPLDWVRNNMRLAHLRDSSHQACPMMLELTTREAAWNGAPAYQPTSSQESGLNVRGISCDESMKSQNETLLM